MKESLVRRDFARQLAAVAAASAAVVGGAVVVADDPKPPAPADQLLSILQARFPDRLNDAQWKEVRGKIEGQLRAADELRKLALNNSDEPATVFAAFRRS